MGLAAEILDELREAIAPDDKTLAAARLRRDEVLTAASDFSGVARTYLSGSIAHGTANYGLDADCGVVLDRRKWKDLGPDGDSIGPAQVVESVRSHVRETLQETYPELGTRLTKRSIKLSFNCPLSNGLDPSVDLIVGLARADGALWIPNLETDDWDPSDPEKHTALLTEDPKSLRVTRARIIRLAKCWNQQYSMPGMCSFNIEALALLSTVKDVGVVPGLLAFFEYSGTDLAKRLTPDPAGVSKSIKVNIERDILVKRIESAKDLLVSAIDDDPDDVQVREALAELYWKHLDPPQESESKAAIAASLRKGNSGVRMTSSLSLAATGEVGLKTTRSYGSGDS